MTEWQWKPGDTAYWVVPGGFVQSGTVDSFDESGCLRIITGEGQDRSALWFRAAQVYRSQREALEAYVGQLNWRILDARTLVEDLTELRAAALSQLEGPGPETSEDGSFQGGHDGDWSAR